MPTTYQIDSTLVQTLQSVPVTWIGTVRPDGAPHSVPVWFDSDGEEFTIYAQPSDQKVRNLLADPRVALGFALTPDASSVVLVNGIATLSNTDSANGLPATYLTKYQSLIDAYGWDAEAMASQYAVQIRIRPTKHLSW